MMQRPALPSWFWLLLSIVSFAASLLTWSSPRTGALQGKAPANEPYTVVPVAAAEPTPPSSDAASAPEAAADKPEPRPVGEPARGGSPRVTPVEPAGGTKVLRCTVRGRAMYIDPSLACPDGAAGKITVLPR